MNEVFVIEKQEVIKAICKQVTKHGHLSEDLAQWVSMWFLTTELEQCYLTDRFINAVAYKAFNLKGSEFKREHSTTDTISVEDICNNYYYPLESENVDKRYQDLLKELSPTEKIWLEEMIKRNGSVNLFCQHTKISRITATERMNYIYNKLREIHE
jgi:hypothetical protein